MLSPFFLVSPWMVFLSRVTPPSIFWNYCLFVVMCGFFFPASQVSAGAQKDPSLAQRLIHLESNMTSIQVQLVSISHFQHQVERPHIAWLWSLSLPEHFAFSCRLLFSEARNFFVTIVIMMVVMMIYLLCVRLLMLYGWGTRPFYVQLPTSKWADVIAWPLRVDLLSRMFFCVCHRLLSFGHNNLFELH